METNMTKSLGLSLVLLSAMGMHGHGHGRSEAHHASAPEPARTLLAFDKMFGVDGAFVGDANPVDDIPGDELPWEIASAEGRLGVDGRLDLAVRGVVFKDADPVPENLRGINDEEQFRAAVSCLTERDGMVVRQNVTTEGFPSDVHGDSTIRAHLELPDPCIAPAVFVLAGSENKWFAVTGFETEE